MIRQDNTNYFYRCYQGMCNNFYEGKLAPCFLPFTTKYFNKAYAGCLEYELPEDGEIDNRDKL